MPFFILIIRACVTNEIIKWLAGVGGGTALGIVGRGVTFCFLNGDAFPDKNMPFFIRLYALVVPLKTIPNFRL